MSLFIGIDMSTICTREAGKISHGLAVLSDNRTFYKLPIIIKLDVFRSVNDV